MADGLCDASTIYTIRLVYMLRLHIAVDMDNSLMFSKYHKRNGLGKMLTNDLEISAYLRTHVFPDSND